MPGGLGLSSFFANASQGFGSGAQSFADALLQKKKMQQQDAQIANTRDFQQGELANQRNSEAARETEAESAAREGKRRFEAGAGERAAELEGKQLENAGKKTSQTNAAKQKELEDHVGGMISDAEVDPLNDREIVIEAMKKNPDVDLGALHKEMKKQRAAVHAERAADAAAKAKNGLEDAQAYEAYKRGDAAGMQKATGAANSALGAHDSALERIDNIIANAGGGQMNFGAAGKVAEHLPTGMQSTARQKVDSDLALLATEMPNVLVESKRAPSATEMKILKTKGLPDTTSTVSEKDFIDRMKALRTEIQQSRDNVSRTFGVPGAAPPSKPSLAATMLGTGAPPPPAAPPSALDAAALFHKKKK